MSSSSFASISHALALFGIDQRTAAGWASTSQSKISRMSSLPWNEVDRTVAVAIFEKICEEVGGYEFTVIGASGDTVNSVSYKRSDTAKVVFHPYRPNEC